MPIPYSPHDRGAAFVPLKDPALAAETPLLESYLERTAEMRRFFQARLGPSADVEDLVQELYLKVCAVPADEMILKPEAFLYRLAQNLMLDRLRARRRAGARDAEWRRNNQASIGVLDVVDTPDAESAVIARQRLQKLVTALETLAPATQRAFRLHKFDGLSQAEAAERMGISRSAVEKHIALALKHLVIRVGR